VNAAPAPDFSIAVQFVAVRPWVPTQAALRRWAVAAHASAIEAMPARKRAAAATARHACIRIVGPAESRRLNREYRGNDKPTNVLSFPASGDERKLDGALGDHVICAAVVAREARDQRKP
jgi:probable rRNA maturation factor